MNVYLKNKKYNKTTIIDNLIINGTNIRFTIKDAGK